MTALFALGVCAAPLLAADEAEKSRSDLLLEGARDAKVVRQGKKLYGQLCASCHGLEGVGGDAPTNLFDAKWVYGGSPEQIWTTVTKGALEKGMPAWNGVLADDDLAAITAYLLSRSPRT